MQTQIHTQAHTQAHTHTDTHTHRHLDAYRHTHTYRHAHRHTRRHTEILAAIFSDVSNYLKALWNKVSSIFHRTPKEHYLDVHRAPPRFM